MSSATRRPLTKTRQAQIILEGTAAAMAVVLLLWLLLWFLWQSLTTFPIGVLFVSDRDLPFQRADAEAFLGPKAEIQPTSHGQVLKTVQNLVSQPNQPPLLLILSMPAFGSGPDARLGDETSQATVESLIRTVAGKAQRQVLLALDFAQIDSDLTRHRYGNSPFSGLEEMLREETFADQTQSVWLLCASGPGQKSWMADGLGRSIFAYYLLQGLSGSARPWDDSPGGGQVVTVEGLARYVRRGVETWVEEHRSKAVQTPVLLPVGSQTRDFPFSGVLQVVPIVLETKPDGESRSDPPSSSSPKARGPSKSEKKDQKQEGQPEETAPPKPPREVMLEDLVREWTEHDRLRNARNADPIRRWLPNGWRLYESRLLNAERMTRASMSDPALLPSAREALRQAEEFRTELKNRLDERLQADKAFPFQPLPTEGILIRNDRLRDLLRQLTGSDIQLDTFAASKIEAPGGPKPPDKQTASAGVEASPETPKASLIRLEESWASGPWPRSPEPYLELQVPIWAGRFAQIYQQPDLFSEPNRGSLLKSAVLARIEGERAMALDRRGLAWVYPSITQADEARRTLQDSLFSISSITSPETLQRQITQYREGYHQALAQIQVYHESRALFERIAAELPYLAEWEILVSARESPLETSVGALPPSVREALDHSSKLIQALEDEEADDPRTYFDHLSLRQGDADRSFRKLRDHYLDRADKVVSAISRLDNLEFRELDELLGTPLLPVDERRRILENVIRLDRLEPPSLDPPSAADLASRPRAEPGSDPGFFRKALGLATLDAELLNLALNPGARPANEKIPRALKALEDMRSAAPETFSEPASKNFASLSQELSLRPPSMSGGSSSDTLSSRLLADDRASRIWGIGRDLSSDQPTHRLESHALRLALERHAERLALDYAPADQVNQLYQAAVTLFSDETAEPAIRSSFQGVLEPVCSPEAEQLSIDESAELHLSIQASPESDSRAKIPPGKAFVGLLRVQTPRPPSTDASKPEPTSKLEVTPEADSASRRGTVVGGLVEVGSSGPSAPIPIDLKQILQRTEPSEQEPFVASVFYRGRGGREEQKSQHPIEVALAHIKAPLHIRMSHDPQDLKTRFPEDHLRILDPFLKHPNEAYIHYHKDLHYRLIFTNNRASDPIKITYQRILEPSAGGAIALDRQPESLVLEPGGQFILPGLKLSWNDFPDSGDAAKQRDLVVKATVSVDGGQPIPVDDFRVRLRQIRLREYMDFTTDFAPRSTSSGITNCWIVHGTRSPDDPVTEPITLSEIRASIDDKVIEEKKGNSILVDPGRNTLTFFRTVTGSEPGAQVKWTISVENETDGGVIRSQ